MVWSDISSCALLEVGVILFQVAGIAALCLYRFFPRSRWAGRGRVAVVLALVGLGLCGAICGRLDSEFALFAGVTMTVILIGMTAGSGRSDATERLGRRAVAETVLAR
jgi:hypothetical protein